MRTSLSLLLPLLLALPLAACAASASPVGADPAVSLWVQAVAERNATARDVAAHKFTVDRPIEDPVREAAILVRKREQAVAAGLDPDDVVQVYRQLMEANKLLQHVAFHGYHLGERPHPAPPLDVTRQRIDAIDERLFTAWPRVAAARQAAACPQVLARAVRDAGDAPTAPSSPALIRALVGFCVMPAP